jgi:hypothetical protein
MGSYLHFRHKNIHLLVLSSPQQVLHPETVSGKLTNSTGREGTYSSSGSSGGSTSAASAPTTSPAAAATTTAEDWDPGRDRDGDGFRNGNHWLLLHDVDDLLRWGRRRRGSQGRARHGCCMAITLLCQWVPLGAYQDICSTPLYIGVQYMSTPITIMFPG